ncbi:hypothetical protein BP5796_10823 [Coleophoma crateriformis]|uniref:Heterokaryon incompatibility domain-containing protein n=1 Tax=Coleophoma crateriformis TaxID=565419 RepID=A0A3D8QLD6_9HELO|nr:hypothetical protein BP5796_10823 [Coleophoma crateriformis]
MYQSSETSEGSSSGMESSSEGDPVLEDERQFGQWPRRLLYVDDESMVSHEWQPGNIYGGYKEPKYNIVSYTWGRFVLEQGDKQHVQGIKVGNISWDVPRIDPDKHFSVAEFDRMIRNTLTVREKTRDYGEPIRFLWLDIACIDQKVDVVKMSEIGRQAVIFQNASSACIWLNRCEEEDLRTIIADFKAADCMRPDMERSPEHYEKMIAWIKSLLPPALGQLQRLRNEPWFTSLWTLQEAYLRQHAVILCRSGRPVSKGLSYSSSFENLRSITFSVSNIANTCSRAIALGCYDTSLLTTLDLINELGIIQIQRHNPFTLLNSASYRKASDDVDRVYGIMQVFGYRLGATRLGMTELERPPEFTLQDLQSELSEKLLNDFPVQSQLKIFTSPPPNGEAWKLSPNSEIPQFARIPSMYTFVNRGPGYSGMHGPNSPRSLSKWEFVSVAGTSEKSIKCTGKVCSFRMLQKTWARLNDERTKAIPESHPIQEIALDLDRFSGPSSPLFIPLLPDFPIVGREVEVSRQNNLAVLLAEHALWVLLLGTQKNPTRTLGRTHYGLIIKLDKRAEADYWKRIGVLRWELWNLPEDTNEADKELLKGNSEPWEELSGILA